MPKFLATITHTTTYQVVIEAETFVKAKYQAQVVDLVAGDRVAEGWESSVEDIEPRDFTELRVVSTEGK